MGSGSMVGSDPSQSFGITSLLFSDTQSPFRDVYLENSREVLPKSISDRSGSWKLTTSTHGRVGLGPIFTY